MSDVYQVLTERLLRQYDPLFALGFEAERGCTSLKGKGRMPRPTLRDVLRHAPVSDYLDPTNLRDYHYDMGRFAFFAGAFQRGENVDPIDIDNRCDAGNIYPEAIVLDGHHRLVAASLVGEKRIRARYGGLVSLLEWLTGEAKEEPSYLC